MSKLPLEGIRVLDFTWVYAGPACSTILGLAGAEVIRVESMTRPDGAGSVTATMERDPTPPTQRRGKTFSDVNQNKRCIALNLGTSEGVAIAKRLAAISDAVTNSYRPGVLDRLGIGFEELRKVNPNLVWISISGMGTVGPERAYGANAVIFSAVGGLSYITGYPEGDPTEIRASSDIRTGKWASLAAFVAMYHRMKTGQGQFVDLAATEGITTLIGDVVMTYAMTGRIPRRQANRHEYMAPHGVYRCQGEEAWISIAVATDAEWQALCRVASHPEWAEDPRFADGDLRWKHQDTLDDLINLWTSSEDKFDLMHRLQKAGVSATPSYSSIDLAEDPHLKDRGVWKTLDHSGSSGDKLKLVREPWLLSRTPVEIKRAGPLLGEDNGYVYGGILGMSEGDIARLQAAQVIY